MSSALSVAGSSGMSVCGSSGTGAVDWRGARASELCLEGAGSLVILSGERDGVLGVGCTKTREDSPSESDSNVKSTTAGIALG